MSDVHSTANAPPPSIASDDALASLLKNLAVRGTLWTTGGFGASQVVRLGFNLVLTRLLFPQLFGLMALVNTIVTGLNLFCDVGIRAIVVRDPRGDDPAFLGTVWTVQIIRGFGLALFCVLIAWPASSFYGDHRLLWIIPVIGVSSIIAGFNSTSLLTLQRHMAAKRLVAVELGTQILSGVVMIVWAWHSRSIWPLISGTLSAAIIRLVWSHILSREKVHRIVWEQAAAQELFSFGRWVWLGSVLTFLASQVDRLILGKLFTLEMLGIYGIATALAELPRGLTWAIRSNVIYPAYSKAAGLPRAALRAKIIHHRWPLLMLMACAVTVLVAGGDAIIMFLYDKRYAPAAWMLPLLALGIWPSTLSYTIESSLFAVGQPRYGAYGNLWKALFTAAGIPLGFRLFGVAGAVIVVALNDLPFYLQISYGLWREGLQCFAQDLKATALLIALLTLALVIRVAMGFGLPINIS